MTDDEFGTHVLTTAVRIYLMQEGYELISIKVKDAEPKEGRQPNNYLKERDI